MTKFETKVESFHSMFLKCISIKKVFKIYLECSEKNRDDFRICSDCLSYALTQTVVNGQSSSSVVGVGGVNVVVGCGVVVVGC